MFSCPLPFQWHLHISKVSTAFFADLEYSPFLTRKGVGDPNGVENITVEPEHLGKQRVKFLIILFCLVLAYIYKKNNHQKTPCM